MSNGPIMESDMVCPICGCHFFAWGYMTGRIQWSGDRKRTNGLIRKLPLRVRARSGICESCGYVVMFLKDDRFQE